MEVAVGQPPRSGSWRRFSIWLGAALILATALGLVNTPWRSVYKSESILMVAAWHVAVGVGTFIPIYVVALIGTSLIGRLGAAQWGRSWASIFTRALIAASILACIGTYFAWYASSRVSGTSPLTQETALPESVQVAPQDNLVVVAVIVQDSDGVTEANLNQESLRSVEQWFVETTRKKVRNAYADRGNDPKTFNPRITSSAVYVVAEGKKLVLIKLGVDESVRAALIMGIIGDQIHRVSCMREGGRDVPVWSGACGEKVKEVFGVSLRP